MAIKQSRQLIPVTPSMPKSLVRLLSSYLLVMLVPMLCHVKT